MAERYSSKGGKEVHIRSTLLSIPKYCMSMFNAPCYVIGKIERLQRDFLWDAADGAKKFHLV